MKTLTSRPLASWLIWAVGLLVVFLVLTWQFFVTGFMTDKSGISIVIIVLFFVGFIQSFRSAVELNGEWQTLRRIRSEAKTPSADGKNGLCDLFSRIADLRAEGRQVDIDNFISLYYARHDSKASTVSTLGSLLITMGLLGTIVGLIVAIQGLGSVVENVSLSRLDMMAALQKTIQGMGIAFYTTFFGALLGGIILRILSANLMNSLTELSAEAMEFCEFYVLPGLGSREAEIWAEFAAEWKKRMAEVSESFAGMVRQVNELNEELGQSVNGLVAQVNEAGSQVHQVQAQRLSAETQQVARQLSATAEALKQMTFSTDRES